MKTCKRNLFIPKFVDPKNIEVMPKGFLLVILLFSYSICFAQNTAELEFQDGTYDFGTIKEEDGAVIHEFMFTNTGEAPVTITNVKASCGCTTPGWTKEPVAPGKQGSVKAQYNPLNRPGAFHKSLTVNTDGGDEIKLYIKGRVKPKPKSIEEELPVSMGDLRVRYRIFNMGKAYFGGEPGTKSFRLYNSGDENIIFKSVEKPDHVLVQFPDTLNPGEEGHLKVTYDATRKDDLGFFSENIALITSEPVDSIKSFTLFTNVEEYFPPMTTEEVAKAPRLSFGEQVFDFDEVKEGEKVTMQFELVNSGHSPLNIRKIDSNCTCVTADLIKNDLNPGESTAINVVFDTEGRRGNQQKAITIYSNDPTEPVQRLTVKGSIDFE